MVGMAVEQFRRVEQADLLRDKRERDLRFYVVGLSGEDLNEYVRLTEEVRHEFEAKRQKEGLP